MGPMNKMMLIYRVTNALLTNSGCGAVLTVFCLPEVDPYFERKKITLDGVTKSLQAAILTLEPNPLRRILL